MFQNEKLREAYEPPFSCDHDSAMVIDKNGIAVVVVRGWGRLSQMFEHDEAFKLQLDIADFIANKLNELTTGNREKYKVWQEGVDALSNLISGRDIVLTGELINPYAQKGATH